LVAELLGLKLEAVLEFWKPDNRKRLTAKEDERVQKVIKRRYEN